LVQTPNALPVCFAALCFCSFFSPRHIYDAVELAEAARQGGWTAENGCTFARATFRAGGGTVHTPYVAASLSHVLVVFKQHSLGFKGKTLTARELTHHSLFFLIFFPIVPFFFLRLSFPPKV